MFTIYYEYVYTILKDKKASYTNGLDKKPNRDGVAKSLSGDNGEYPCSV